MRNIPLTVNGNHDRVIGFLVLGDDCPISDESIVQCNVNWMLHMTDRRLIEVTLVPRIELKAEEAKKAPIDPPQLVVTTRGEFWVGEECKVHKTVHSPWYICMADGSGIVTPGGFR